MMKIGSSDIKYLTPERLNGVIPNKKTLSIRLNEFPKQAKNGVDKTVKGVFNEEFYKKYISSDEKLREILKTNSKKENFKFCLEIGKLTLIFGGLVAVTVLPVPGSGALYATSIPKLRKLPQKLISFFEKVRRVYQ